MPDYYTEKEKKRAIDSFSAEDKEISAENPEYGEKLAQIKQNYNASTTDEERDAWHNEAEKLSNEYGYTRNDDGSDVKALSSNFKTIQNFDKAYGKEDKNGYQSVINALLADLSGAKFTYSAKDDPRYTLAQEYASDAMRNQMAESAALTGGYGNSYAAESGQKVYDSYIDSAVNDMEDRAYTRWQNEQNDKYTQLNTLIGLDNTQYSRQRDAISDARYSDETAYNRQRDAIEDARYEEETAYNREQDTLDRAFTEQKYADSLAEIQEEKQNTPRLNLSDAISLYQSGVESSEVMKALAYYLGDDYNDENVNKYGKTEEDEDVTTEDATQYIASLGFPSNISSQIISNLISKEDFYKKYGVIEGVLYDSYADYVDKVVNAAKNAYDKTNMFRKIF